MNKTLDVFHESYWVQLAKSPRQRQTGMSSAKLWECINRRLLLMLLTLFWLTRRAFPRCTLGALGRSPPCWPCGGLHLMQGGRGDRLMALFPGRPVLYQQEPLSSCPSAASCPRPVYVKEEPLFQSEILNRIILFLFQYRRITHSL